MISHIAWLADRHHVGASGIAAFKILNGYEYRGEIVPFGEVVMAKHPEQSKRSRPRWIKGIWVGKSPIDDIHIVLTREGAKTYRSIRRLAKEQSADENTLAEVKGLPWSVKHGVRLGVKAAPEKSEVVVIPLSNRFSAFEANEEESPYGLDEEDSEEESNESVKQADAPAAASADAADTDQKVAKRVKFDLENIPIRKLLTEG